MVARLLIEEMEERLVIPLVASYRLYIISLSQLDSHIRCNKEGNKPPQ